MAMDPYEGYQTHFGFDHFDLETMALSRLGNDPYSDCYNLGWRNHPNFSLEAPAMENSASYPHGLDNQAYLQSKSQSFYPPSNFHPPHQQWQSSPYNVGFEDKVLVALSKLEVDTQFLH
jgi:hypothetical protein